MTPEQQLQSILIGLGAWATITTIILMLSRRDVKLGLKKWFYLKFKKQPLKIRYYGPDKNVLELIVGMKGKGETVTLFDRKLLIFKTKDGMTFFIDDAALIRCDDGINELNFSYKSVMPINPNMTPDEVKAEVEEFVQRLKKEDAKAVKEGLKPSETEQLVRHTDPKRLNKLIDYIYLAAKADALAEATDVAKWVKITAIGVGLTILGIIAVYYTLDGKVIPLLQGISSMVGSIGSSIQGVIKL